MTSPALELGPRLRAQLAALRRRVRASLLVRGFGRLATLGVALALLSFALDRPLRLAWETRATLLVAAVTGLLVLAWRWWLRPLATALPLAELARAVERVEPRLEWRLVSAVQFTDPAWEPGPETSRALAAQVVADAEALAASPGVAFGRAVPLRPVVRAAARGLAALGLAAVCAAAWPGPARTWFERNVLLSPTARWPQDTELALLGVSGRTIPVPHGASLELLVEATGVIPRRVLLESEREGALPFDALGGRTSEGAQRFRAQLERVTEPFAFTVVGGDAELGPYEVEVVERPWLEGLRLAVEPPGYTGLPARTFDLESTDVELPVGARVRALARVSAPLRRGWLEVEGAGEPAAVHTGVLAEGGRTLEVPLLLDRTQALRLRVEDEHGFGLDAPVRFTLRALPDAPPAVSLALRGVGTNITRGARLRYAVEARDDYGLRAGALRLRITGGEPPAQAGAPPAAGTAPGAAAGEVRDARDVEEPLAPLGGGAREAVAVGVRELERLELPLRAAVTVWALARDGAPSDPDGQVGASPAVHLRVVPDEELINELLRRLQEVRLQLERLADEEDRLAAGLRGPERAAAIERAAPVQHDVSRSATRAGDVVEGVVDELETNQLLDAPAWERLRRQVVAPLRALPEGALARALAAAEAAAAEPATAAAAAEGAAEVARELRAIAARIGQLEDLAALVAELKRVIREQRELLDRTRRASRPGGR